MRYKTNQNVYCAMFLGIKLQEAKTCLNKLIFSVHEKTVKSCMHVYGRSSSLHRMAPIVLQHSLQVMI
jgi:hypothetical protein